MKKLAILISGTGSNMIAINDACEEGIINAEVAVVISNVVSAPGIQYASNNGIPSFVVDHRRISRQSFDEIVSVILSQFNPDYVCLAGFMRILGEDIISRYEGRMINIHPSLLPKYPGLNTHERVLDARDAQHGATVHYVIPELDAGPIIQQVAMPMIYPTTAKETKQRLIRKERQLYVQVMRDLCQ